MFPSPHKILQASAQPHLSLRYLGMVANPWKPTFPIQSGLIVNQIQTFQPFTPTSQIPDFQCMSQPIQAQVHVSQPL